ncbi:HD family phosphohydrolase [Ruminococcaceae bacterium OttesenSCG-928-O06]|nr:HD family phosphohydrolase [Ruminococcaceae bacterium OttesenSCG-928-O06]
MWKPENRAEFGEIVADILRDPEVLALADVSQHSDYCSRLDHSIYVSYISFLACRRLGLDHVAAARAGLLHDFHFADESASVKRLWRHPHDALENAEKNHELSDLERDIIVKHMWPLTRPLPRHKETFVVSLADKFCAMAEFSWLYRLFKVKKKLVPLAA